MAVPVTLVPSQAEASRGVELHRFVPLSSSHLLIFSSSLTSLTTAII